MPKTYFLPLTSATRTPLTRREFVRRALLASSLAAMSAPSFLRGQNLNGKVDVAVIGAGGKGATDTEEVAKCGANIVALCDVDMNTLAKRGEIYPDAKRFQDYRQLLDTFSKKFDAVVVSTPDHHHATAALPAMKMGKHAFVQKPLTQSVYEARALREAAKKYKVATQMGNQGSAGSGLRRAVEVIQAGILGQVRELHVWSNRPIWPQGIARPEGEQPAPESLDWDVWLGPASKRPYTKGYHPFAWRGFVDFGTGALGDMACHTVNMPFRALKLGYPSSVEATSSGFNKETYPKSSKIVFQFPEREGLAPLKFTWYDGNPKDETLAPMRPGHELTGAVLDLMGTQKDKKGNPLGRVLPGSGCLLLGDKGELFSPDDYGSRFHVRLKGESVYTSGNDHEACKPVPESIPRSPGHYQEWIDAIRGGAPGYSNFDIAAYLTEIILLGCVALRAGKRIEWDGPKMKATNTNVSKYVKRSYRRGWKL